MSSFSFRIFPDGEKAIMEDGVVLLKDFDRLEDALEWAEVHADEEEKEIQHALTELQDRQDRLERLRRFINGEGS